MEEPVIIEQPIKILIKIDNNNNIVEINSSIFVNDFSGWIQIDEGFGDKFAHAQSQYLDKSLINEEGQYNYKYVNNKIIKNQ